MKNFKEFVDEEYIVNEMANYIQADTGLTVMVWVDETGIDGNYRHSEPRIKFQNDNNTRWNRGNSLSMIIDPVEPYIPNDQINKCKLKEYEVQMIKNWVVLNYEVLMKIWNHEWINSSKTQLMNMLKPIDKKIIYNKIKKEKKSQKYKMFKLGDVINVFVKKIRNNYLVEIYGEFEGEDYQKLDEIIITERDVFDKAQNLDDEEINSYEIAARLGFKETGYSDEF